MISITSCPSFRQVILGFVRPNPKADQRPMWNLVHHNLGRVTLCAAWTTIYLGIYLAHTSPSYLFSYSQWLAPVVVVMGFMVILDITLSLTHYLMSRDQHSSEDAKPPTQMAEMSSPLADGASPPSDSDLTMGRTEPTSRPMNTDGVTRQRSLRYQQEKNDQLENM